MQQFTLLRLNAPEAAQAEIVINQNNWSLRTFKNHKAEEARKMCEKNAILESNYFLTIDK